jgi:hypothetical protein
MTEPRKEDLSKMKYEKPQLVDLADRSIAAGDPEACLPIGIGVCVPGSGA